MNVNDISNHHMTNKTKKKIYQQYLIYNALEQYTNKVIENYCEYMRMSQLPNRLTT